MLCPNNSLQLYHPTDATQKEFLINHAAITSGEPVATDAADAAIAATIAAATIAAVKVISLMVGCTPTLIHVGHDIGLYNFKRITCPATKMANSVF